MTDLKRIIIILINKNNNNNYQCTFVTDYSNLRARALYRIHVNCKITVCMCYVTNPRCVWKNRSLSFFMELVYNLTSNWSWNSNMTLADLRFKITWNVKGRASFVQNMVLFSVIISKLTNFKILKQQAYSKASCNHFIIML